MRKYAPSSTYIFVALVFIVVYFFIHAPKLSTSMLEDFGADNKIYALKPEADISSVGLLHISEQYPENITSNSLTDIFDRINVSYNHYNHLYYATRLVAQIKNEDGEFPDIQSWESKISRYEELINGEIANIPFHLDQNPNLYYNALKGHVANHESELVSLITNTSYPEDQKKYLYKLLHEAFSRLQSSIITHAPKYDPAAIRYSLSTIAGDKEYGKYNVRFDFPEQTSVKLDKGLDIKIGKHLYQANQSTPEPSYDILIKPGDSQMQLQNTQPPLQVSKNWQGQVSNDNSYQYLLAAPATNNGELYLLEGTYNFNQNVNFDIYQSDTSSNVSSVLLSQQLLSDGYTHNILIPWSLNEPAGSTAKLYFRLTSPVPLTEQESNQISFVLKKVLDPPLLLEKIDTLPARAPQVTLIKIKDGEYDLSAKYTSAQQDRFMLTNAGFGWMATDRTPTETGYMMRLIYWPKTFWLLTPFILLGILFIKRFYRRLKRLSDKLGRLLFSSIKYLPNIFTYVKKIAPLRFVFAGLTIALLLIDIFTTQQNGEWLIMLMILMFSLTSVSFRWRSNIIIYIGLVSLGLSVLVYL